MKTILMVLIGNIRYDGRVKKEIKTLMSLGYSVELIVSQFDVDDSFDNYNFKVWYVPRNSYKSLALKFIPFIPHYFKIKKIIDLVKPDFLHCHDFTSVIYAFGSFSKTKVIYDSHELVIGFYTGIKLYFAKQLESYIAKNSYKIIQAQIDRLNLFYFAYQNKINYDKIHLVENFPERTLNLSNNFFEENYNFINKNQYPIISYTGHINEERALDILISSVQQIPNVFFFIIGSGSLSYIDKLEKMITTLNLSDRVFIKPPVEHSKVMHITNSSDIGVCFYNDPVLNSYFCASNKLYEYLNCKVKVLTNDIAGTRNFVINNQNGILLREITEENITTALKHLIKLEIQGQQEYYWENQIDSLKNIYTKKKTN